MSFSGLVGALLFLALGIAEMALANRFLYPALRWRHERAKLTQTQGIRPATIMALIKVQSLILLPLIGIVAGERLKLGVPA
ncbi:MAG: hypothetical protein ACKOED_04760 [Aestuariivirga sp.]|uniref:hypothetical protein n=1 Tax=Aestuariivirga sp. TaxID=2650926 RepID=UPI0038D0A833